jgi:hypothetical protein
MVLSYDYSNQNNECTSVVGHFDGHGGVPVRYEAHHLMQHDKGFTGSHWTPPLGNDSLRIAPSAARAAINSTMMQHVPALMAVLMAIAMRQYYTARIAQWRRFLAFFEATIRHHPMITRCNSINPNTPMPVVLDISL